VTKTKKSLLKAAQASQALSEELHRIQHLQSLPFVMDFVSGWAPKETPTEIQSLTSSSIPAGPNKRSSTMLASSAPKPKREPGAQATTKRSTSVSPAAPVAPVAAPTTASREIHTIDAFTPTQLNMAPRDMVAIEWAARHVESESAMFAHQYEVLLKFLKFPEKEEGWREAKQMVVAAANLLRNASPEQIQPSWTSQQQELHRITEALMPTVQLPTQCNRESFDEELVPALRETMKNASSQSELLRFLGFQRLEQIYRYGYHLSSHQTALSRLPETQNTIPSPTAPQAIRLNQGIPVDTTTPTTKKRPLPDETSIVPHGPTRKVAKLAEHHSHPTALAISVSDHAWEELIDQTLAAKALAAGEQMRNPTTQGIRHPSSRPESTPTSRSSHGSHSTVALTAAGTRPKRGSANTRETDASVSSSSPTTTTVILGASKSTPERYEQPTSKNSFTNVATMTGPGSIPGTSRFFISSSPSPRDATQQEESNAIPQNRTSSHSSSEASTSSPSLNKQASVQKVGSVGNIGRTPSSTPPIRGGDKTPELPAPRNPFHSDEAVQSFQNYTVVYGTGGGAPPIVVPAATTNQGISITSRSALPSTPVISPATSQQSVPRIGGAKGSSMEVSTAKTSSGPVASTQVTVGKKQIEVYWANEYDWKNVLTLAASYWTKPRLATLKSLAQIPVSSLLVGSTHSVFLSLVGEDEHIVAWRMSAAVSQIGREVGAKVMLLALGGTKISREHAVVEYSNRSWSLKVLGKHGVYHNGERKAHLDSVELKDGDEITIHFIHLIFRSRLFK
jgi:hypothetical protein